ncbi:MAG: outer membrane beta-barrel protein [Bacteroidales bacterium]|nr:outer membrane beta-barrel protein [Bacteroidales bacterium]
MKRIAIIALLLCIVTAAQAQVISAYISGGGTVSQIQGDELDGFDNLGWSTGIGTIASLDQYGLWFLSTEAIYTRRGSFNNSGNPYNIYIALDYIDIPLLIHYRDPIGRLMVGIGPVYGRLIAQPHGVVSSDSMTFMPDINNMAFLKNDFSLAAEMRFQVWRGLHMSLRWQHSVFPVKKDWLFTEHHYNHTTDTWTRNCYNNSITIRLLWQFGQEPNYRKKRR